MGGFAGLVLGLVSGWLRDVPWPVLFCRACVVALALGLLLRWWWGVCLRSLQESVSRSDEAEAALPADTVGPEKGLKT